LTSIYIGYIASTASRDAEAAAAAGYWDAIMAY